MKKKVNKKESQVSNNTKKNNWSKILIESALSALLISIVVYFIMNFSMIDTPSNISRSFYILNLTIIGFPIFLIIFLIIKSLESMVKGGK